MGDEVAARFSEVTGRRVRYTDVPRFALHPGMRRAGLPGWMASGRAVRGGDGRRARRGRHRRGREAHRPPYRGIPAPIVTLAGLTAWRGVAQLLPQGYSIPIDANTFLVALGLGQIGPPPVPALVAAVVVVLGRVVMNRTRYGQYITGIGPNEEAVRRAGVNTRLVKLSAYILTGAAAALGGMIYAARLTSGSANAAVAFEL